MKKINTYKLDELIDSYKKLPFGKTVSWHGKNGKLIRLKNGMPAITLRMKCSYTGCKNKITVYLTSGLHSGAWPYVRDLQGKYLANLRDQNIRCHLLVH